MAAGCFRQNILDNPLRLWVGRASQDERPESTPDDWRAAVASVHVEQPYHTHTAGSSVPASHVAASYTPTSPAAAAARLRLPPPPNTFDLPPPTDWLAPVARGGRGGGPADSAGDGDGEWERSAALAEYSAYDTRLPPSTPSRKQYAREPAVFVAAEETFNGGWGTDEDDKLQLCESMFQPVEESTTQRRARRASESDASVRGSGGGGGGVERGALRPDGSHYVRKQPEYLMMQIVKFQKRIAGVNPDQPCTSLCSLTQTFGYPVEVRLTSEAHSVCSQENRSGHTVVPGPQEGVRATREGACGTRDSGQVQD
jgi:hypothetical protein